METWNVIKYPIVTEKGTALSSENKYLFCVALKANKNQVKKAVEEIYKVRVSKVHIINQHGKKRRLRYKEAGYKPGFKKVIVTLKEGDKIAFA